jgi:serine/threonine-protein kinase HipA
MAGIDKIFVSLILEGQEHQVGELVLSEQKIYFRYYQNFLKTELNLSPIKLPFNGEIHTPGKDPFDGLYGVFNDSLPDGWGRLLLDRTLSSKGINIAQITPLDRLTYVGARGMGALIYKPEIVNDSHLFRALELDLIGEEVNHIN